MTENKIRKIIQKTGFDFHRHYPTLNRLDQLKDNNIKTVFDVGANVGQFAKEIRKILPDAFIYSFEPLSECFKKLTENMVGDSKFKAFNFALGEKDEILQINRSAYSPSSSILDMADAHKKLFPHTKESAPEKITVKKLDDLDITKESKGEILLKIDTQGYEDRVFRGSLNFLKKVRFVVVETSFVELYKGQPLFANIYSLLKNEGFTYKGSLQQKTDSKTGEVISEDSLFTKD
jgi:FkbM family methyltransferase